MATKKDTKSKPVKKPTAAKAKDLTAKKNVKGGPGGYGGGGGVLLNHHETLL